MATDEPAVATPVDPSTLTPAQSRAILEAQGINVDAYQPVVDALLRKRCIESFAVFVQQFWPVVEPVAPLEWNWHLDIICNAVQKQIEGRPGYRKLLIEIPPGYMKSLIVSVFRPAWVWLRMPWRRSLYFSCSDKVTKRDSLRTRNLVTHEAYQIVKATAVALGLYKEVWTLSDEQNEKINFQTSYQGSRETYPIGADFTGVRADDIALDDLLDVEDVRKGSPEAIAERLREINSVINNKVKSRVNNKKTACWTLIMQALAVGDPADMAAQEGCSCCSEKGADVWHHICIPLQYDPDHPHRHPKDPRKVRGELLMPSRDGPAEVRAMTEGVGAMEPQHFSAQYNQTRITTTGGLFTEETFLVAPRYHDEPDVLLRSMTEVILSVDCTFKKTADSDRVAIHCWGRKGWGRRWLIDRVCKRMTFMETLAEVAKMQARTGATVTLVEDKANGPAAIEALQDAIPGLLPITPIGSKYERTQVATAPLYGAKQIVLPDRAAFPWVADYERVHRMFRPGGNDDDDIDAESQAMAYWTARSKQAPWIDIETPGVLVRVTEPAWSALEGHAHHYLHTPSALRSTLTGLAIGLVAPFPGAPDAGHVGCAVALTPNGEVLGHVEAPRSADLAARVYALAHSVLQRCGRADGEWQRRVRVRIVNAGGAEAVTQMERALRDYRLTVLSVSATSTPWPVKGDVLAYAAATGREMVSNERLRILDPKLAGLIAQVTLNEGIPETPRIRLVDHRWMRKPVSADAMLVALLAAVDVVGADLSLSARQAAREESRPKTQKDLLAEHYRNNYANGGSPMRGAGPSAWAALRPPGLR